MFQSSGIASGISRRHASTACWPSSASEILKSNPSRMRRATLRMTLESSTTKQLFMAPPRSSGVRATRSRSLAPCPRAASCRHGAVRHVEHAVDVENHHQLSLQAVNAAGDAGKPRVEIDRVCLARVVAELEHLADAVDHEPVG